MRRPYRVWLFPISRAELAYETDTPEDAEAFVDEFNRREAERNSTGLAAAFDAHGALARSQSTPAIAKPEGGAA